MSAQWAAKSGRGLLRTIMFQVCEDRDDKSNEYIDQSEMIKKLGAKVIKVERWECPLNGLSRALQVVGMVHQGVVVTLEGGQRYLIHKLPMGKKGKGSSFSSSSSGGCSSASRSEYSGSRSTRSSASGSDKKEDNDGEGDAVVAYASKMGKHWTKFDEKKVASSKLSDYLDACGSKYDVKTDNCIHAVNRMWQLK